MTTADKTPTPGFEPRIVAYLCTWCSYTGADTAGIARLKSPANVHAIRVPCSGRVSPELIMRTFDQGADGVLVLACHIGECHYDSGNHRTAKRLPVVQALMSFAGLEPERLRLDYVSASEGERFARITTEFTETLRALGPAHWRLRASQWGAFQRLSAGEALPVRQPPSQAAAPPTPERCQEYTQAIQDAARQLLSSGQVSCVIGYERGTHGRTRPVFIYEPSDVERLVWNAECTHNLATYLRHKLQPEDGSHKPAEPPKPVAVVAKPCDSRAINVLLVENQFSRQQVHIIGVVCDGVYEGRADSGAVAPLDQAHQPLLQSRCQDCAERVPLVYDTLVGEPPKVRQEIAPPAWPQIERLEAMSAAERAEYWLSQFDRCIRCYACRQACPMCNCPTCLYERDDSLWTGMGIGLNEKRAFHLGRAFHLAGRCVGCNECERACPMGIPISLLNQRLAQEVLSAFGHRAGLGPSPFVTVLGEQEA
ncbi:MAG: hydrogenase iron-sulfur subunit [Anaerolineales bacterium]|nr:hydrogenase iron-sulfur subunit [Anaerolineales bacterium]